MIHSMQQTHRGMDKTIPDKCPICGKKKKSLLLHIKKKDSCYEKIDKDQYEIWKKEINKQNNRKSQAKYAEDGSHTQAQKKYMEKCYKDDYRSTHQIQEQRKAQYKNREFVAKSGDEKSKEQRMRTFQKMCCWALFELRKGQICTHTLNQFHLIEADFDNLDRVHSWMKMISCVLLSNVMTFQQIALVPRSRWKSAIEQVENDPSKEKYKDKIYKIIGKLKSYNHGRTKGIKIPEGYESECKAIQECPMKKGENIPGEQGWKKEGKKEISLWKLSSDESILLIRLIIDIIGDEKDVRNGDFGKILKIHKIFENIETALFYVRT